MKVYGAEICIDCRNFKYLCELRGLTVDYTDITASTDNLKEFLKIRDHHPAFQEVRDRGGIGIPLFVKEDGDLTLDVDLALSWIGESPVRDEEIREHRAMCDTCK